MAEQQPLLNNELATQLLMGLGEIKGQLESMGQQQDKIYKAIYGNGQPGLQQRVNTLEADKQKTDGLHERVESLERIQSETEGGKKAITNRRLLLTSAIGSVTAFLGMIYHLLH